MYSANSSAASHNDPQFLRETLQSQGQLRFHVSLVTSPDGPGRLPKFSIRTDRSGGMDRSEAYRPHPSETCEDIVTTYLKKALATRIQEEYKPWEIGSLLGGCCSMHVKRVETDLREIIDKYCETVLPSRTRDKMAAQLGWMSKPPSRISYVGHIDDSHLRDSSPDFGLAKFHSTQNPSFLEYPCEYAGGKDELGCSELAALKYPKSRNTLAPSLQNGTTSLIIRPGDVSTFFNDAFWWESPCAIEDLEGSKVLDSIAISFVGHWVDEVRRTRRTGMSRIKFLQDARDRVKESYFGLIQPYKDLSVIIKE